MSESSSVGYSSSTPVTPPADLVTQSLMDSISGVAQQYAQQVYQWGQGVFNNLQSFTNENVAQLTTAADTAMSGANTSMQQFTGSFLPDYQNLRDTAAQYASPAREARNAGMAESDQMQAGDAARVAAEQNLQSMGIDPSSGRYADLEEAQRTATGASAAGAGTQSIRADESTALGLQKEAMDYGIQLPGIAANFLNQADQARSIAQNAQTATANTGANLMQLPNAYLSTAMNLKYPPSGQASSAKQNSQSTGAPPRSTTTGGGAGGGPSGGGTSGYNGMGGAAYSQDAGYGGGYQPNASIQQVGDYSNSDGSYNYPTNSTGFDQYSQDNSIYGGGQTDPFAADYGGSNTGYDQNTGTNLNGSDPSASYNDPYSSTYSTDPSSYGATQMGSSDAFGSSDNSGYSSGGFDDTSSNYSDYGSGSLGLADQSTGTQDMSDFSDDTGGDFAKGGAIPDPSATHGGQVPLHASPSHGMRTDDVHARLNANEFVIPRDVALWKGQEFFQKLIAQSRKNRATAPAHGKPAAPPMGPVRFASHPVR